jgi:hypothetical protein
MRKEEVKEVAVELTHEAIQLGWTREETRIASTGSIYIELSRRCGDKREWVMIRVADHKQVYDSQWIMIYSWSPYEYDEGMIRDILSGPFGEVGDIL